jgi:hypothetical protein
LIPRHIYELQQDEKMLKQGDKLLLTFKFPSLGSLGLSLECHELRLLSSRSSSESSSLSLPSPFNRNVFIRFPGDCDDGDRTSSEEVRLSPDSASPAVTTSSTSQSPGNLIKTWPSKDILTPYLRHSGVIIPVPLSSKSSKAQTIERILLQSQAADIVIVRV